MKKQLFILLVLTTIISCRPELDAPQYSPGDADFTRFVMLGSGQMAGFNDGALTVEGQKNSIGAIIGSRLQLAGGGNLNQPLVNEGNGFGVIIDEVQGVPQYTYTGKIILQNTLNCKQQPDVKQVVTAHNPADRNWIGNQGPFQNLGVPNIKSFQIYSQQLGRSGSGGNPYYVRFARDTGATSGLSSTILQEATMQNPTFFVLWIGNSDIFSYASKGGAGSVSGLGTNDITPVDTFANAIDYMVNSLTGNRAKGVISNLPDLTSIPYYTVIPWNGLNLTQTEADYWNTQVLPGSGITFTAGANGFIYSSGSGIKQMKAGELVTMRAPLDSIRCFELGTPGEPLSANYVLDSSEVMVVRSKLNAFNAKLQSVATAKNLAFADLNSFYKTMQPGLLYNGNTYKIDYLTGGIFSVDGIYPSPRGYAMISNVFIDAINAKYKSNLPPADVNAYPGVKLP